MSSIGTGYDLAASTFSPDGRIFQIEYAQKAVDNSGTIIALRGKEGVVTAVDKVITSKLLLPSANPRIFNANDNIGLTFAGVYPDARALLDRYQSEALDYLRDYREPIPTKKLATALSEYIHTFTLGISRPFGCSTFVTSYDQKVGDLHSLEGFKKESLVFQKGGAIYLTEPSGLTYEYKAWAVGKHRQAAKTEIEKLKLDEIDQKQLVKEAARILLTVRDESKDKNLRLEMGWVGANTNGKHQLVPQEIVQEAERWAKAKLEEDDLED